MQKKTHLKNLIQEEAQTLGFDLFGVVSVQPLDMRLKEAQKWLESGYAAGMRHWLERDLELRFNPAKALDGAKSLIMLGVSYSQPAFDLGAISGKPEGRIARFAQGIDYHLVLPEMLDDLTKRIHLFCKNMNEPKPSFRIFVDSGPLAEKQYAVLAGLGFIGRNGLLIHPEYGSWFFLCGLLTTLELPADAPIETPGCGDCNRCAMACPSAALANDTPFLNASRCLSYWTIETREDFPDEILSVIGNRLFGCDTCQDVCPYNANPLPCRLEVFAPLTPPENDEIMGINATLDSLSGIKSNREFNKRTARSPLLRCRKNGMRRNLKAVAGNLGRDDLLRNWP